MNRFSTVLAASMMLSGSAMAQNLVMNGSFENLHDAGADAASPGYADNWSYYGFNVVYKAGNADVTGSYGFVLWGPNSGSNNGLPATSPDGGNFFAADAEPRYAVPVTQTIANLTVNQKYTLGFWYGLGQQSVGTGADTGRFNVTFGGQSFSTALLSIPSAGFSGWQYATTTFTASATSQTLSFTAGGSGTPPMMLLDGITLTAPVPEPTAIALILGGLGVLGLARRRQLRAQNR